MATKIKLPDHVQNPNPERYWSDSYIVLDFETIVGDGRFGSAIDKRNKLALACWCDGEGRMHSQWGDEYSQQELINAIRQADFIVGHNLKYEYGWLHRIGLDVGTVLGFDTQIAEYVLLGNLSSADESRPSPPISISLDSCGIRRGMSPKDRIVDEWMANGITVDQMPTKWVEDRCKQDVETTRAIFLDQRRRLGRTGRLGVLYTRCLLTPVLAVIETNGVHLDKGRVAEEFTGHTKKLGELEREFIDFTGGINFRSPKQVGEYIYGRLGFKEPTDRSGKPKRTASGKPQTSLKILDKLRASTDLQRTFITLRKTVGKVAAALSKNLNYFKEVCDNNDGIFYGEFNQTITATHRLSGTGIKTPGGHSVQLTNIPRAFKRLFTARKPGWLIGEADGSQLEFRVATYLGNDRQGRADLADPEWDAHCVTAAAMQEKPYIELYKAYKEGDKKAKDWRQDAKPETFKPLYGGSKGTPAQERWYKEFKKRYPDLAKTQEDWVYEVLQTKRLITPWGMRWYFPHAKMSDSGYCNVGSAVYNYPVQSLATAEIIPIALSYLFARIQAEGLSEYIVLVNTVHDSIIAEIHPDHVEDFKRLARIAFGPDVHSYLSRVYKMDYNVALGTSVSIGTHWSEGKEEKFEYAVLQPPTNK